MPFLSSADFFFKIDFVNKYLRHTINMSNILNPDFVGPDLSLNCLQRLSVDDTRRQRVIC